MFHVFQVVSLGFSRNSSKFQNLHREDTRNYSKSQGIYIGRKLHKTTRTSLFQVPDLIERVRLRIFPSSRAYMGGARQSLYGARAQNFSKSQGLYGTARFNISLYFFIFLHTFDIFLYIFHIFLYIFDIVLHIYCIKEFPYVTSSGGGCTRES